MKKIALLLAIAATVVLAGCTPVMTEMTAEAEPTPTVTVESVPEPVAEPGDRASIIVVAMQETMTKKQIRLTCAMSQAAPTVVWDQFNSGADNTFTRAEFEDALNYMCS